MEKQQLPNGKFRVNGRARSFISNGFETLVASKALEQRADLARSNEGVAAAGTADDVDIDFDIIIIGSGYGGAIAAAHLSGCDINARARASVSRPSIAILERGDERLPGAFPASLSEIAGELRVSTPDDASTTWGSVNHRGRRSGLFDLRVSGDVLSLVGNGVGGGSLINAGVMLQPSDEVLAKDCWPSEIRAKPELDQWYSKVRDLLGASKDATKGAGQDSSHNETGPVDNVVNGLEIKAKHKTLATLAPEYAHCVPITVNIGAKNKHVGVQESNCIMCGECASGCNHAAKRSLDTNLLHVAVSQGVQLYAGTTVTCFDQTADGRWALQVEYTDETLKKRTAPGYTLYCSKLIVAAGAFGSTEIMMRSQQGSESLRFSAQLGGGFTGGGDMSTIANRRVRTNNNGREGVSSADQEIGPTTTAMLDFRSTAARAKYGLQHPLVIQEIGVPASISWLLRETMGVMKLVRTVTDWTAAKAPDSNPWVTVTDDDLAHATVLAVIGNDQGVGKFRLSKNQHITGDGGITVNWEQKPEADFYSHNHQFLRELVASNDQSAHVYQSPLLYPLGEQLKDMLNVGQGPYVTVHPLGGCVLADDVQRGVVNHIGQVFMADELNPLDRTQPQSLPSSAAQLAAGRLSLGVNANNAKVYENLVVLDGAIIPTALGVNPALTISAIAQRAIEQLAERWDLVPRNRLFEPSNLRSWGQRRPYYRHIDIHQPPQRSRPTKVELAERMSGSATMDIAGTITPVVIEITIRSQPFELQRLSSGWSDKVELHSVASAADRQMGHAYPDHSFVRIYRQEDWQNAKDPATIVANRSMAADTNWAAAQYQHREYPDQFLDNYAVFKAPLGGSVEILHEVPRWLSTRLLHGAWAWFCNRGYRDLTQWFEDERAAALNAQSSTREDLPADANTVSMERRQSDQLDRILAKIARGYRLAKQEIKLLLPLLAHAGRQRKLSYKLKILHPEKDALGIEKLLASNNAMLGEKTLTYSRASNPWLQLMQLNLKKFPGRRFARETQLDLDADYLARMNSPLLRIVEEDDAVKGYAEIAAFYARGLRTVALGHFFSFRAPDSALPTRDQSADAVNDAVAVPQRQAEDHNSQLAGKDLKRLPHEIEGLERRVFSIKVDSAHESNQYTHPDTGESAHWLTAQLTRYHSSAALNKDTAPVIMIHGYSASGTTYAHSKYRPGMAEYFSQAGREVWVLDMRTSCGLLSRTYPWKFEDLARFDIPVAISQVLEHTQTHAQQVDIVAHCMGAVMFSMAVLDDESEDKPMVHQSGINVSALVRRVVLFQAGPIVKFSPGNTLRAFVLSYLKEWMPYDSFEFNPEHPGAVDRIIDRILTTLPYPLDSEYEFKQENPWHGRALYTGARHRMDMLYGQDFLLRNTPAAMLDNFDDFFGPMNIRTPLQALWIARRGQVSRQVGEGYEFGLDTMEKKWQFATLWIHGASNGLLDPVSPVYCARYFDQAGIGDRLKVRVLPGYGHQDTIMGKNSTDNFAIALAHLEAADV